MRRLRVCWIASLSVIASIATPATAQSLDVVIGQALADSPTMEAAHAREDAALAAADRARAERGPVAAVSG